MPQTADARPLLEGPAGRRSFGMSAAARRHAGGCGQPAPVDAHPDSRPRPASPRRPCRGERRAAAARQRRARPHASAPPPEAFAEGAGRGAAATGRAVASRRRDHGRSTGRDRTDADTAPRCRHSAQRRRWQRWRAMNRKRRVQHVPARAPPAAVRQRRARHGRPAGLAHRLRGRHRLHALAEGVRRTPARPRHRRRAEHASHAGAPRRADRQGAGRRCPTGAAVAGTAVRCGGEPQRLPDWPIAEIDQRDRTERRATRSARSAQDGDQRRGLLDQVDLPRRSQPGAGRAAPRDAEHALGGARCGAPHPRPARQVL